MSESVIRVLPDLVEYPMTGAELAMIRQAAGYTRAELADFLAAEGHSVAVQTIGQWERGKNPVPRAVAFVAWGLRADWLGEVEALRERLGDAETVTVPAHTAGGRPVGFWQSVAHQVRLGVPTLRVLADDDLSPLYDWRAWEARTGRQSEARHGDVSIETARFLDGAGELEMILHILQATDPTDDAGQPWQVRPYADAAMDLLEFSSSPHGDHMEREYVERGHDAKLAAWAAGRKAAVTAVKREVTRLKGQELRYGDQTAARIRGDIEQLQAALPAKTTKKK